MTHALKVWPEYFEAIKKGEKTFDIRKEDRPFAVGDNVILQEYDPEDSNGLYTGRELSFEIGYILRDVPKWGLKPGHCILQLKELTKTEKPKE